MVNTSSYDYISGIYKLQMKRREEQSEVLRTTTYGDVQVCYLLPCVYNVQQG